MPLNLFTMFHFLPSTPSKLLWKHYFQRVNMASVSALLLNVATVALFTSISAQPAPGCPTHCGDVKIPYPFGIGTNCSIGPGFELYCNMTADGSMKPFIINVEVLNISLINGQTRALNSLSTYCYDNSTRSMNARTFWLDFAQWPYRFSNIHNRFIVIGCNTLAYNYNRNNRTGYTTACASVCGSTEALTNGSCAGVGCCQNAIPKGLTRYDVYFYNVYNIYNESDSWRFNPCSYAALVETDSFSFNIDYITTLRFNDTYKGRQPLILDWAIGDVGCDVANMTSSYACRSKNSECVDSTNGPGYLCNCTSGYNGNPYLPDGCIGMFPLSVNVSLVQKDLEQLIICKESRKKSKQFYTLSCLFYFYGLLLIHW